MAPRTSATGGYLAPRATPAPLEGQALQNFLQQFVVGITGMAGTLVRPRWQGQPPPIPPAATAWCAVGILTRQSDTFPYLGEVVNDANPDGAAQLQRHEKLNLLASFYDLGIDGEADSLCTRLRDGLIVPQNLEPLFNAGMGLNTLGDMVAVPSLFKTRWLYRIDLPFVVIRQIVREYPVLTIVEVDGTIEAQEAGGGVLEVPINVVIPS